jgi:hypothetical protein
MVIVPMTAQTTVDQSGGLDAELMVHRPTNRAEWIDWLGTQRATRTAFERRGQSHLIEAIGLDADTIAATMRRWDGPPLTGDLLELFAGWFGAPRPVTPDPEPAVGPVNPIDGSNRMLVDRLLDGDRTVLAYMSREDRVEVARRMHLRSLAAKPPGQGISRIQHVLRCNGLTARSLLDEALARDVETGAA